MRLVPPIGHEPMLERLFAAARAGRLPHALCFEGPAGTGKFVALRWFAAGLLCARGPGGPCLACGPCKRVLAAGHGGGHPDLLVIDAEEEGEEQIRVGRIAERSGEATASVEAFLALRTVEGGVRAILIREAHRMNTAAQNALLKTLEEPRPGTLLLLETHRPDALLPTIKSRCVRVRAERPDEEGARAVLEAAGHAPERAAALVRLAPGSPGEAERALASNAALVLELAAEVLAGRRAPLEAAAAVGAAEGSFPGATPAAKARARASAAIGRLAALAGDLLRRAHGAPALVPAHGDVPVPGPPSVLARATLALAACRADVGRNLSPDAALERAFLLLADLARPSTALAGGRR